jgi:hypothetical protein
LISGLTVYGVKTGCRRTISFASCRSLISGLTVYGVKTGRSPIRLASLGGGGRFSTGFSSKVVGAIVMSSSSSVAATTGTAGREICSGGGGISTSGGNSIASNSLIPKLTSDAVSSKNHWFDDFLNRSFAVCW